MLHTLAATLLRMALSMPASFAAGSISVVTNQVFFFFFLHQDTAAVWASKGKPLPGHCPPLWAASVLSRALPWTTGRKDFKSTSGVAPLQDFLPVLPGRVQCPAMCSVSTNNH